MSLDTLESEIAGLRSKAAELADSYAQTQAEITADPNLTESGKRDALAPLHQEMMTSVAELHQQEKAIVQSKRDALERTVFGTNGTSAEIGPYREAQSIAARITDSDDAQAVYTSALRSNDNVLAQAVFAQANERGWSKITADYFSRNPSAKAALDDLERIRQYEQKTLGAAMHYMTPRLSTAKAVMPVGISPGEMNAFFSGGSQGRSQV